MEQANQQSTTTAKSIPVYVVYQHALHKEYVSARLVNDAARAALWSCARLVNDAARPHAIFGHRRFAEPRIKQVSHLLFQALMEPVYIRHLLFMDPSYLGPHPLPHYKEDIFNLQIQHWNRVWGIWVQRRPSYRFTRHSHGTHHLYHLLKER